MRSDSKPGSFHISREGLWHDFASDEGGDIIQLVERLRNCKPREAAEWILEQTGHAPVKQAKGRPPKVAPLVPIPDEAKESLNKLVAESSIGKVGGGWKYYDAAGGWAFAVVRYNTADGKSIRPYYYGTDKRWHEGKPQKDKLPLYRLPELLASPDKSVLVVEGEKCVCAAVEELGDTRRYTTWSSGASSVSKTDWAPLADAVGVMWPDRDMKAWDEKEADKAAKYKQKPGDIKPPCEQAGHKAAMDVHARCPHLEILDVWRGAPDKPDGWDIADAIAEGLDVAAFIADCPRLEEGPEDIEDDGPAPYECIGYDKSSYWFLKGEQRILSKIDMGRFTASLLGELAPPAWWAERGAINDKGGIDVGAGQQIVIERETKRGFFRPEILRGSGVWLEDGAPVINDGDNIISLDGEKAPIERYASANAYVRSALRFDDKTGDESTDDDGRTLCELVQAQGFVSSRAGVAMLGWSLIAPFGGVLPWRPMVWLTGKTSNGKSWFLDNVVVQLCGHFHFKGTKRTSEASTRRATNMIACPVILDEMTPKSKDDKEKIGKQIELAKNSSGDSSGTSALASGVDSYVIFVNRSPFCFAGVNVPEAGAEIANRFIVCELQAIDPKSANMERKIARSSELYAECMGDPSRYRRRIFHALPRILKDIDTLRAFLPRYVGGQRMADVWAPMLAAAWAVQSSEPIEASMTTWLLPLLQEAAESGSPYVEDEDRVIEHILSAVLESDAKKKKTVAEWLIESRKTTAEGPDIDAEDLLARQGLRVLNTRGGRAMLAIATSSDALSRLLRDTPYEAGYDAQIRRNVLCVNPEKPEREWMAGRMVSARLFDWDKFREVYMGGKG